MVITIWTVCSHNFPKAPSVACDSPKPTSCSIFSNRCRPLLLAVTLQQLTSGKEYVMDFITH